MITPSRVQRLEKVVVEGSKHVRADLGFQMNGYNLEINYYLI